MQRYAFLFGYRNLGLKKFDCQNIWVHKIFGSRKCFVSNKIWVPKQFGCQKSYISENLKIYTFQTHSRHIPNTFQTPSRHPPDTFRTPILSPYLKQAPVDPFCKVKLGEALVPLVLVVVVVLVTLENKVNSEPDLFKYV